MARTRSGRARAVIQPLQEEVIKRKAEDGWAEISSLPPPTCSPSVPCTPAKITTHTHKRCWMLGGEISVPIRVEADGAFWVRLVNKSVVSMQMNVYIYSLGNGDWIRTVTHAHPGTWRGIQRQITILLSEPIGMRFRWLTLCEQTGFQDWHE